MGATYPPLTPAALLRQLHRQGASDPAIAAELSRDFGPWNKRQVWYLRTCLGLPAVRPAAPEKPDVRHTRWRALMTRAGWAHLLPSYVEADPPFRGFWTPGIELRPREVSILCALRDRGPLTRRQLSPGRLLSDCGRYDYLLALYRFSLIESCGRAPGMGGPVLWRVVPAALPAHPANRNPPPDTSVRELFHRVHVARGEYDDG